GKIFINLCWLRRWSINGHSGRDQPRTLIFEPVTQRPCREAVVSIVPFDRRTIGLGNVPNITELQTSLNLGQRLAGVWQFHVTFKLVDRLELLDRIALNARSNG